ncbi:MAG: ATP synthase F1 subunit epsilon [Candidatus Cloacimonetes bacterium]|nr:ATP synthase F1 subunit epsilon [Candidatus Cloacimonadota bacterium]
MADPIIELRVILPHKSVFDGTCDHVIIPGIDGDFGVSAGHTPFMTVIRPGIMEIFTGEDVTKYALHDGFVSVENSKVTIVCETIEKADEIDRERAEAAKKRAEKRIREKLEDTDFRRAEIALKKALIRLEI